MQNINNYRGSFLDKDGQWIHYPIQLGNNHPIIVEDYCNKKGYLTPSEDTVTENGDIYFRNANNNIFVCYMPKEISELQLYQLELLLLELDPLEILAVEKNIDGNKETYQFDHNIASNFSEKIIQSYYQDKEHKRSI